MNATLFMLMWINLSTSIFINTLDLEYVRIEYKKAPSDKNVCRTMIKKLSNNHEGNVHLAYLGAYQMIWANHTPGLFSKFATFKTGRNNIEKAINENPKNAEIRMIRLSVQKNCPLFLGYNDNIREDTQFLEKYRNTVSSVVVMQMINGLLSE